MVNVWDRANEQGHDRKCQKHLSKGAIDAIESQISFLVCLDGEQRRIAQNIHIILPRVDQVSYLIQPFAQQLRRYQPRRSIEYETNPGDAGAFHGSSASHGSSSGR